MPHRLSRLATAICAVIAVAITTSAFAHQVVEVADGQYKVIAGYLVNPAYSGQLNGIDLAIRDATDQPITGLEGSLTIIVIAPDGTELTLTARANAAKDGWYTANFIPAVAGNYDFRVSGFIGEVEFEAYFDEPSHSDPAVLDAATITLP